ncbi:molecular chaperone [Citrobacter portucalensis]|uniref:fimbrial biogenesis chaperone n=1 Tax=Citrobacter portucalensis TaxID=1639133 RepID=UPI00226BB686|nr:molecular chaperone [Citrobacter portucalensis]MCX9039279.1 molecular chaperone [Citrobacter portucalensis]
MKWFNSSLTLCLLLLSTMPQAGIVMGGTRIIFEEKKSETSLSITNDDSDTPYLVQSWVENYSTTDTSQPPFIVTPPLFRLDPEQKNAIRINFTGANLPSDRESVYWLNVKNIAPTQKDGTNKLQINIKSKFKIFYRPTNLQGIAENAWQHLLFTRSGNDLVAHNPTPYFVSFFSLSIDGQELDSPGMIAPFSDKTWAVSRFGIVRWRAIDDFGRITDFTQQ